MIDAGLTVSADYALRTWARWMRSPSDIRALGYPAESCGFANAGVTSWGDEEENLDLAMALGVDAIVSGLMPIEQSAIHNQYLHSVFRGRPGVLEEALEHAILKVGRALIVKGLM